MINDLTVSCWKNQYRTTAWVVQKVDSAIHWLNNHYPEDSMVCFVNIYPLHSIIQKTKARCLRTIWCELGTEYLYSHFQVAELCSSKSHPFPPFYDIS